MAFRFKWGKAAVLTEDGKQANVLVLAQLTERGFAGTKFNYRVVDEYGEVFDVEENELEKPQNDEEEKKPEEEKVEVPETKVEPTAPEEVKPAEPEASKPTETVEPVNG